MANEVLTSVKNGVLIITLNRPEARNAANRALAEGVAAAIDQLEGNDELRVGILTGAGGTFCSGMDLKAFVDGQSPNIPGRGFGGLTESQPQKPLIGAVEGYALAGGLELAIACDMLIAAETAQFGIPEVKRGLAASAGGLARLPRQIPVRIAMELALTGDFISAERAAAIGLINQITPEGGALAAAEALAAKIAANGPLAVAASKQVMLEQSSWSDDELFAKQKAILGPVFSSEDATEGAKAFAENRPPQWQGK